MIKKPSGRFLNPWINILKKCWRLLRCHNPDPKRHRGRIAERRPGHESDQSNRETPYTHMRAIYSIWSTCHAHFWVTEQQPLPGEASKQHSLKQLSLIPQETNQGPGRLPVSPHLNASGPIGWRHLELLLFLGQLSFEPLHQVLHGVAGGADVGLLLRRQLRLQVVHLLLHLRHLAALILRLGCQSSEPVGVTLLQAAARTTATVTSALQHIHSFITYCDNLHHAFNFCLIQRWAQALGDWRLLSWLINKLFDS